MTRKHFRELAKILNDNNCDRELLQAIMKFCKSENRNFDAFKFVEASGFTVNEFGNYVRHPDLLAVNITSDKEFFLNK